MTSRARAIIARCYATREELAAGAAAYEEALKRQRARAEALGHAWVPPGDDAPRAAAEKTGPPEGFSERIQAILREAKAMRQKGGYR